MHPDTPERPQDGRRFDGTGPFAAEVRRLERQMAAAVWLVRYGGFSTEWQWDTSPAASSRKEMIDRAPSDGARRVREIKAGIPVVLRLARTGWLSPEGRLLYRLARLLNTLPVLSRRKHHG